MFHTVIGSSDTFFRFSKSTKTMAITEIGKATITASRDDSIEAGKSTLLPVNSLHIGRKVAVPAFMNSAQNR